MNKLDKWNRKDVAPTITVKLINDILRENGINTHIVDKKQYSDCWASVRIESIELSGIGANGKGVGEEYTLASAYGELIERIQGGALISPLFQSTLPCNAILGDTQIKKCVELIRQYFNNAVVNYSNKQLFDMIKKYPQMGTLATYYDVNNSKFVEVPERFLGFICGTNGIAAGNTYEEAFCQGLCEIFERYVMKQIYSKNNRNLRWPTIPREIYRNTNSIKMIEEIEKKGYHCIVKNCTMNGKYPVVGLLVLDSSRTKYLFRLGSDLNLDLALQRCITEIFQGISFDVTFRMQMQSIFPDSQNNASIWNYRDPSEGVTKAITSGSGVLPYTLFNNEQSNDLKPFVFEHGTNKDMVEKLICIAKNLDTRILIKDCSYLGFPTLHIFIPEVSDAYFYDNNMDYLPVLCAIGTLGDMLRKQNNSFNYENTKALLNQLLLIRTYETFKYNTTLNKFTGICLQGDYPREIQDIDYVIGLSALAIREYDIAKKYLRDSYIMESYIRNPLYEYVTLIIDGLIAGIKHKDMITTLKVLKVSDEVLNIVNTMYDVHNHGFSVFCCSNCTDCKHNKNCSYDYWKRLNQHLIEKEKIYNDTEAYTNCFFKSLTLSLNNIIKRDE